MAGNLRNLGYNVLTFGPMKLSYGPKGITTHYFVTCPTIAPLINYYNYIVLFGASGEFEGCDVGNDGVTSAEVKKLSVSVPGVDNILNGVISQLYFDQWEMLSNESNDTIFANPLIFGGSSPVVNYNGLVILSYMVRNGGSALDAATAANADLNTNTVPGPLTPPTGTGTQNPTTGLWMFDVAKFSAAAYELTLEIAKEQSEYDAPTFVLRHTSYIPATANYGISAADLNPMCIYPTANLLSEISSGWTYNCPNNLLTRIAAAQTNAPLAPIGEAAFYTAGWLKKLTRQPVLANFMVELNTEYEFNLWSNLRYFAL